MSTSLTPLEAIFLDWEDSAEAAPMHFAWTMVFDPLPGGGAPSLEAFRHRIAERLHLLPRFKERLSAVRVGRLFRPRWIPDARFDIARQVDQGTLPAPGGDQELLAWLADFATRRIDRRRPLWQLTLFTDLPEGRWAAALKVHHCMIDGVGSAVASLALLMDAGTDPHPPRRSIQGTDRSPSSGRGKLRPALTGARTLARMLRQQPDPPAETSLMVSIGPNRHLAFVDVPLARLKAIRSRLGGAVNDVVLTAVVGGLRALFEQRGEMPLPDYLRVLVPVNMRTLSEEHSIKMNVSFFAINLPLAGADLLGRYQGTVQTTQMLKQSRRAATDQTLVDFAAMIPPVLQRALTRYVHPLGRYDVMVTNVPGSQGNVTFMGAPIHRVLPAVPPTTGHALNVVVCSYSGTVTLGIHADRDAVPDLDVVRAGIERALDQLAHTTEENRHRGPSG